MEKLLYSSGFSYYGDLDDDLEYDQYDQFGFKLFSDDFWEEVGNISDLEQNKYQIRKFMRISRQNQKNIEIAKKQNRLTRTWLFKKMWKYGKYKSSYKQLPTTILRTIVKNLLTKTSTCLSV